MVDLSKIVDGDSFQDSVLYGAKRRIIGAFDSKTVARAGRIFQAGKTIASVLDLSTPFDRQPTPLLGGITLRDARDALTKGSGAKYAHKNFFIIKASFAQQARAVADGGVSVPARASNVDINFFATEVSYNPTTIGGEARQIGAAIMDGVSTNDRTDLRITTLDDQNGRLKKWFRRIADRAAQSNDGTFSVPAAYVVRFDITHAVVEGYDNYPQDDGFEPYTDTFAMRPAGIEFDLSRRDVGMQEITMSWTQVDTFMDANAMGGSE